MATPDGRASRSRRRKGKPSRKAAASARLRSCSPSNKLDDEPGEVDCCWMKLPSRQGSGTDERALTIPTVTTTAACRQHSDPNNTSTEAAGASNKTPAADVSKMQPGLGQEGDKVASAEHLGSSAGDDGRGQQQQPLLSSLLSSLSEADAREIANYKRRSNRPPLGTCTEEEFLADYKLFHETTRYGSLKFSYVHGMELDIFNLYRQACQYGGFDKFADGINWTGQVFPSMKNWKEGHKQTGIGNHLRTQYCKLLLQYERLHPDDLNEDCCKLCLEGESASRPQWLMCATCEGWFHYRCALSEVHQRPKTENAKIHAFASYEKAKKGAEYTCSNCLLGAQALQAVGVAHDEPTVSTDIDDCEEGDEVAGCVSELAASEKCDQDDDFAAGKPSKSLKRRRDADARSALLCSVDPLATQMPASKLSRPSGAAQRRSASRRKKPTLVRDDLVRPSAGSGSGQSERLKDFANAAVVTGDAPATPASAQSVPTSIVFSVPTRCGIVVRELENMDEQAGGAEPALSSPCTTGEPDSPVSVEADGEIAQRQDETTSSTSVARVRGTFEDLQERMEELAKSLERDIESCSAHALLLHRGVRVMVSFRMLDHTMRAKRVEAQVDIHVDIAGQLQGIYNQLQVMVAEFGAVGRGDQLEEWYSQFCQDAKLQAVSQLAPVLRKWCDSIENSEFHAVQDTSNASALRVLIMSREMETGTP